MEGKGTEKSDHENLHKILYKFLDPSFVLGKFFKSILSNRRLPTHSLENTKHPERLKTNKFSSDISVQTGLIKI